MLLEISESLDMKASQVRENLKIMCVRVSWEFLAGWRRTAGPHHEEKKGGMMQEERGEVRKEGSEDP